MSRTAHTLTALAAAAVTSILATSAGAADVPSIKVRYADLNLQTSEGVSALYGRLTAAAREVCPDAGFGHLSSYQVSHNCQQAAIARAVGAINNPMLARMAFDHGVSND